MVAKKQGCHSIAPADKQINEEMVHPTSPNLTLFFQALYIFLFLLGILVLYRQNIDYSILREFATKLNYFVEARVLNLKKVKKSQLL